MIETTGRVMEVSRLSGLEDEITILTTILSPTGKEEQTRSLERAVPTGTVKIGTILKLAFLD